MVPDAKASANASRFSGFSDLAHRGLKLSLTCVFGVLRTLDGVSRIVCVYFPFLEEVLTIQ